MNPVQTFAKLLRVKALFQRINQLSWSLQKLHNQYPRFEELSGEEHLVLLNEYETFLNELKDIYENLNNEYNGKN